MKKIILAFLLTSIFIFQSCVKEQVDNSKHIDPTIGNVAQFLVPTYPTMHLPNQMLRMFPDKEDYLSDELKGFPFHVSGHRKKEFMEMKVTLGEIEKSSWKKPMYIDHDLEIVHPWLYSTYLIEDEVRVSFTPSKKSAIYKLEFPADTKRNLLISGIKMNGASLDSSTFSLVDTIIYDTKGVHSVTRKMCNYIYGELTDENSNLLTGADFSSKKNKFSISFPKEAPSKIFIKYAVSNISLEQAMINFKNELDSKSFDNIVAEGKAAWDKVMGQIDVEGGTEAQKRTFYTSLYRTYERMVDINEYGKYYSGYDGKVHESDRPFLVDDWIWDTYLATHPLRTIINPELENDMLNSYTLMYEQSGLMPTFPQVHGNHMCMNAYHSSSIFIDGYRKGLKDYDVEKAYEGIKKNLTQCTFIPWRQGEPRTPLDDFYLEHGYFPSLQIGEKEKEPQVDDFEKRQPVPVTLGISFDFWAMSELAKDLGKEEDYQLYSPKAKDYKNIWHPKHRLFMPKDSKGKWVDIDPKSAGGPGYREYYDENNGWTYAWDVKHDVDGLAELLGGKEKAEERLDQLFREPLGMKKKYFYVNGSNSTGMVGQFSMGNEPSFHIPYLYNYYGAPWKTQKRTRFLLDVWYKDNIFGIPGDEDGGGMTAFVVFTSMGIYPVTPGIPVYNITSPVFEKVSIKLTNGKVFTVLAEGADRDTKYIQRAFINGEEIFSPFITHNQIMSGATLTLELADYPNKEWGKEAVLPEF